MKTESPKENLNNKLLYKNSNLESNLTISYPPPEKFDFITKSKEMNSFKEDILLYLKERDSFLIEKINSLQLKSDINTKKIEDLSETLNNNYNSFLLKQVELSSKLEKFKTYDSFVNKANDKLISQEIRINAVREDMNKNFQKYDKMYLENLIVPGYIGKGAKYTNCKIFFTEVIKNLEKLNIFKEKNIIDLNSYKVRLENIIKTFQFIVDSYNNAHIKYITKLNEQTNKNILETIDDKVNNLRMENSHFSLDLLKKTNELNSVYDKIKQIKNNISQDIDKILLEYNNKIEETNKSFNEYKEQQEKINKKYMSLFNLIKVEKYSKNFRFQFGSQRNNDLKNIKNNYESNENNIKLKNFFELKSNFINNRLSKSQNNFNSKTNLINIHKKINITDNSRKIEIKKQRNSIDSLLNFSRTSSVKSYQKANNIFNYNLNIKKQKVFKTKMPLIDTSKSQRNNHTTLNLINNLNPNAKKEKDKMISYEELTDIKTIKTNNKEDDISLSGNSSINMNNSLDSYSTMNDINNNTINNINIKTKLDKFNSEKNKDKNKDNDKIIKEIAAELEQSSAKGNILCSNKKEIEKNFKSICDKIQPINLKLNNLLNLDKIDESVDKNNIINNNNNFSNKSEQSIFSNNNVNNININNFHLNENITTTVLKKNKLKELIEAKDKTEENNNSINNKKEKENINLEERMNLYDTKIINLEGLINSLQKNIIKIINSIKKEKEKKNKNVNSIKILGYKTINNTNNSFMNKKENNFCNNSMTNKENENILNLTGKNFNKKSPTIEISSRLSSMPKSVNSNDNNNLSQNMFHNGKYYANIKHIFGQKKFENKKLLKPNSSNKENDFNIANNNNYEININSFGDKKENKFFDLNKFRMNNNII